MCKFPVYDLELSLKHQVISTSECHTDMKYMHGQLPESTVLATVGIGYHDSRNVENSVSVDLKSCMGYRPLYWQACVICYILGCASPQHVGSYVWENVTTVRTLMLMSITERFHYPPAFPLEESLEAQLQLQRDEDKTVRRGGRGRGRPKLSRSDDSVKEDHVIAAISVGSPPVPQVEVNVSSRLNSKDNLTLLLNINQTSQRIAELIKQPSGIQTAVGVFKLARWVRNDERRIWETMFTPQPLLSHSFAKQEENKVKKEQQEGKITEKDTDMILSSTGELIGTADEDLIYHRQARDENGVIISQSQVIDGVPVSEVADKVGAPRRSGRQRVTRFNVVDVMRQSLRADYNSSDNSDGSDSDEDGGLRSTLKRKRHGSGSGNDVKRKSSRTLALEKEEEKLEASRPHYSQHSTLWGLPQPSDLIVLPLQGIHQEPPETIPDNDYVSATPKNQLSSLPGNVLCQVKRWHEAFSFGSHLRSSTSPDFIAAVMTGENDEATPGDDSNGHGDDEVLRSRQHIMESIGWLIPAITAESRSTGNESQSSPDTRGVSFYRVLQRIPPVASVHLLLVIALKCLHEIEGPGVRFRQLVHLTNTSGLSRGELEWNLQREHELVGIFVHHSLTDKKQPGYDQDLLTAVRRACFGDMNKGCRGEILRQNESTQESLILDFVNSKSFMEDSVLFTELADRIRGELWAVQEKQVQGERDVSRIPALEYTPSFLSSVVFALKINPLEITLSCVDCTTNLNEAEKHSARVGDMIGVLLVELWHPERERRVAARLVFTALNRGDTDSDSFECISQLLGASTPNASADAVILLRLILSNIIRVETEPVVICQVLRLARRTSQDMHSLICSVFIDSAINCLERLQLVVYLASFYGLNSSSFDDSKWKLKPIAEIRALLCTIVTTTEQDKDFGSALQVTTSSETSNSYVSTQLSTDKSSYLRMHVDVIFLLGSILAEYLHGQVISDHNNQNKATTSKLSLLFSKCDVFPLSAMFNIFEKYLGALSDNEDVVRRLQPVFLSWGCVAESGNFSLVDEIVDLFPPHFLAQSFRMLQLETARDKLNNNVWPNGFSLQFVVSVFVCLDNWIDWTSAGTVKLYKCLGNVFACLIEMENVLGNDMLAVAKPLSEVCPRFSGEFNHLMDQTQKQLSVEVNTNDKIISKVIDGVEVVDETEKESTDVDWALCLPMLVNCDLSAADLKFIQVEILPALRNVVQLLRQYLDIGEADIYFQANDGCGSVWETLLSPSSPFSPSGPSNINNSCSLLIKVLCPVILCCYNSNKQDIGSVSSILSQNCVDGAISLTLSMLCSTCPQSINVRALGKSILSVFNEAINQEMTCAQTDSTLLLCAWVSLQHIALDVFCHIMLETFSSSSSIEFIEDFNYLFHIFYLQHRELNVADLRMMILPTNGKSPAVSGNIVNPAVWVHISTLLVISGYELIVLQNQHLKVNRHSSLSKQILKFENNVGEKSTADSAVGALLALTGVLESSGLELTERVGLHVASNMMCSHAPPGQTLETVDATVHNSTKCGSEDCLSCLLNGEVQEVQLRWRHRRGRCKSDIALGNTYFSSLSETRHSDDRQEYQKASRITTPSFTDLLWSLISCGEILIYPDI